MNKRDIDFTPKKRLPEALLKKEPEIIVLPAGQDTGRYFYVRDICRILGCGRNTAYKVIAGLQAKLPDHGLREPPGRISRKYFMEHLYAAPGKEDQRETNEY